MSGKWTEEDLRIIVAKSKVRTVHVLPKDYTPLPDELVNMPESARGKNGGLAGEDRAKAKAESKRRRREERAQVVGYLAAGAIHLEAPWPPSVNHYWLLGKNGSRFISAEGNAFRAAVATWAAHHPDAKIPGTVALRIMAHPADNRRRDLDNILKSLLDALMHAGLIEDDSNVCDLHIIRGPIIKGGCVKVQISPILPDSSA